MIRATLSAFAADLAWMFRSIGHDIAAPFKDAAFMRRERQRMERGE